MCAPEGEEKCTSKSEPKCPNHYSRCTGEDSSIELPYDTHPVDGDAYKSAAHLFYADIIEEKYQQKTYGFFCHECLKAYGLVTDKRMTLLSVIKERMAEATTAAAGFG